MPYAIIAKNRRSKVNLRMMMVVSSDYAAKIYFFLGLRESARIVPRDTRDPRIIYFPIFADDFENGLSPSWIDSIEDYNHQIIQQ